ncbi:hypothetical protein ACF0H5_020545 [Mactra antiquata]
MISIRFFLQVCFLCSIMSVCYVSPTKEMYTKVLSSKIVRTKYGQMRGALVEFKDPTLKPVISYLGLQFASTLNSKMRFMPPVSTAEKWKSIRVTFKPRSVCPQEQVVEDDIQGQVPQGEVEKMKRISHWTLEQIEECLTLNLYVPTDVVLSKLLNTEELALRRKLE